MTEMDFGDLPDDDPDLLENTALPKQFISRLRKAYYTRLSDFDDMDDIQMLREPGINWYHQSRQIRADAHIDAK